MLTSLLPPATCAACRLCCNFCPSSTWETPALEPELAERLEEAGMPLVEREGAEGTPKAKTFRLEYATESPQECALCPLLDVSLGCTLPREERPFECRLWPLRLMQDEGGQLMLAYYAACPGLAAVSREQLLALVDSLRPALLAHAHRCPASVRPLHPNYTPLCTLDDTPLPCPVS